MKDKLRESVSALVDNEAEELEIRRILSQAHDQEVLKSWQHFHQIRASLKPDESRWAGVDLSAGINAALDESLPDSKDGTTDAVEKSVTGLSSVSSTSTSPIVSANDSGTSKQRWRGLAIAASVAFAVVFAVQFDLPGQQQGPVVAESPGNNTSAPEVVANGSDTSETAGLPEFSKEHEARLNEYIMRHTGHAALNTGKSIVPFARLTSFEPEQSEPEAAAEKE